MAGKITFSILDNSNETGRVQIHTPTLDGSNIGTYTDDTLGGALGDLRLAISALIEGNHLQRTITAEKIVDAAVLPANPSAQRERKASVTYRDVVTGKLYRVEIPTFNMAGAEPGTDILDLDVPAWAAFVAAFENYGRSELENNIQVIQAKHVGRRS